MPSFEPEFLEQLRGRVVLSELVARFVRLVRRGREMFGLCPFHPEKTPSFSVSDEKGFYYCFGCGARGDAFSFLENIQNLRFAEAVKALSEQAGLPLPQDRSSSRFFENKASTTLKTSPLYALLEQACVWFESQLLSSRGQKARDYLASRGFSMEVCQHFRVGFAPIQSGELRDMLMKQGFSFENLVEGGLVSQGEDGKAPYDRFRQRIIFPIFDDKGRVVAFGGRLLGEGLPKYLNSSETVLFSKSHQLYGWQQAQSKASLKKTPVVIVEGYMDVIALQKAGIARAVAPLGTALTPEQILKAWHLTPEPFICFDGDAAGQRAAVRAAERVLPLLKPGFSLRFIRLPLGEDPDSLVASGKEGVFQSLMAESQALVDFLWQRLMENPTRTPEEKALFQNNFKKLSVRIQDACVRFLYEQAFRERWKNLLRKERSKNYPFFPNKSSRAGHFPRADPFFEGGVCVSRGSFDSLTIQRKILLAVLINHPNLLRELSESVALLTFSPGDFYRLRGALLSFEAERGALGLGKKSLEIYLTEQGHQETVRRVLAEDVYAHASFAREDAAEEEAREGWLEIFERHQFQCHLAQELKQTQKAFEADMSEASWARLRQLKESYSF